LDRCREVDRQVAVASGLKFSNPAGRADGRKLPEGKKFLRFVISDVDALIFLCV